MLRFVLFAVAAVVWAPTSSEACQPFEITYTPVTKDGATIESGGGIVLVANITHGEGDRGIGNTLRFNGKPIQSSTTEWIPNVEVLRPPVGAAGTLELLDAQGKVTLTVTVIPAKGKLAPLAIKRVASNGKRNHGPPMPHGIPYSTLTLELATPLPADALGIVEYDAVNGPRNFIPASPGAKQYQIASGGKSCGHGNAPTFAGERMGFAWVTGDGRISPIVKRAVAAAR